MENVFLNDEAAATSLCGNVESVALCLPEIFRKVDISESSFKVTLAR